MSYIAPPGQVAAAAVRFLYGAQHLPPAALGERLDDCADHLVSHLGVAPETAADVALRAWARIEGAVAGCWFDLEASTPHLVFLVDPVSGMRRAVSVVDLLRLIGPRAVGDPERRQA